MNILVTGVGHNMNERFLEEWDNGMDVNRMEEWLKSAYNMGLKHRG